MATTKKKRVVNASGKRPVKKVATASTGAVMKKKQRRTKRPASVAGTWFGKMGREKQKQYTDKHPTSIFSRKAAKKAPLDKEMDGLRRLEDKLHNLAKQHDEVAHQTHKDMSGKRMQKKKLGDLYEQMAEVRSHIRAAKQDIARKKAA